MTRTLRAIALVAVLALGSSCARPAAAPRVATPAAPSVPNLHETQLAIDAYITSGRYDADFAAVVLAARAWLEERAPAVDRPAIVLDIDETSLSNWQAYQMNGWGRVLYGPCDLQHGPCSIRAWQSMGRAPALAPTVELVRRARELGVAVFFITGRPPDLRRATEHNLRAQGFTWDGLVLLPGKTKPASAVDFKAPERRKIAERGYSIVLSMGDQQSDLDGGYAEKTFKLPNPVYFLP